MRQIIKFLKIRLSEIMNRKNETVGWKKIFLMLLPYQTALDIFKPQFSFLVDQLGHSFTIIGY
jgi:alpha-D-ribose 1-methylphosphonate 5-triphosphate synthase subunit PhnL